MLKDIKKNFGDQGQAILEFAFCMIIVFFMAYGMIQIFKWTAEDLIGRGQAHETQLISTITCSYFTPEEGPLKQITPAFYYPTNMKAVVGE